MIIANILRLSTVTFIVFSAFQYANDLRYEQECGTGVATHDHTSRTAVAATKLATISHLAETCSVIGIDEGQFVSHLTI